ncbi:hypothetical protein DINM_021636 [Dirofilaria immitis]|nr:hypothetical protein [Dirofilaria immitis]
MKDTRRLTLVNHFGKLGTRLACQQRWYINHNECMAKKKRSAFVPTMNLLGVPQNCLSKLDGFRIMGFGAKTEVHLPSYLSRACHHPANINIVQLALINSEKDPQWNVNPASMDVVDGQIIDTLCRLDPFELFDGLGEVPSSIAELSTETFYQAIVTLVWSCKQSTREEIPSTLLPQNMAAKFRCVATVVNANIGVRDSIDYHMLLYGRSKELRNVLIGLMENYRRILQSSLLWKALSTRTDFIGFCGNVMVALHYDNWRHRHSAFICSLLENNAVNNNRAQNCQSVSDEISAALHLKHFIINKQMKPQLKPKPILSSELQKKRKAEDEQEINEVSKVDVERSEILNKLLKEIMALTTYVDHKKISKSKRTFRPSSYMACDCMKFSLLQMQSDENYIDGSNERMQHLQNLWLRAKTEKDEEVKTARLAALSSVCKRCNVESDFTLPYQNQAASTKDTKLMENELVNRKKTLKKLRKQVESQEEKQINRSIYTKHIFDIIGNIRKQQNEISKIAGENLCLQKEIKSDVGKLERSFIVVEGKLLLMKIHGECSCVITGIDSSGQIEREIEELNDQVSSKSVAAGVAAVICRPDTVSATDSIVLAKHMDRKAFEISRISKRTEILVLHADGCNFCWIVVLWNSPSIDIFKSGNVQGSDATIEKLHKNATQQCKIRDDGDEKMKDDDDKR